jgi:hypothetical protein
MTIFKNEMTIEDASKLLKSKTGMSYPDTPHNRKMMRQAIDNCLKLIREKNAN